MSVVPTRSAIEIYIVAPTQAAAIGRGGKFTATFKTQKQRMYANGKQVDTLYSVKATVDGTIHGKAASGTVKVTYNKNWMAYDPGPGYSRLTIAACSAKTTWSAARK